MTLLFVYGSLKRGFLHHDFLAGSAFVRAASTAPGYQLVLQGEYPALALDPGAPGVVEGELYLVGDELLPELDHFEGCPELYQRENVVLDDGTTALSYVISAGRAASLPRVAGAAWVKR
jgi:gamma-glutamylcyclotransferase (GGCT)/AIG2-like uncharacterized protein YtfP